MRKILSGFLGIVAVLSVVSASAYAVFTANATVSGIQLQTSTSVLSVSIGDDGNFQSTRSLGNTGFNTLIPGKDDWGQFALKNESSTSSSDPLNFGVTAQLTHADGDWDALKDQIEAVVYLDDGTSTAATSGKSTGWVPLSTWNAGPVALPGGPIAPGATVKYIVRYRLNASADNSVAGKSLTNVTFVFTGTQQ